MVMDKVWYCNNNGNAASCRFKYTIRWRLRIIWIGRLKSILDFNTSAFVYDDIFDEWKASSIDEYEQCEVFPVYPELFYIYIMKHLVNVVHNNSSILHKNFTQKFYTKTSYKNFYWVFKMWLKQITLHDF